MECRDCQHIYWGYINPTGIAVPHCGLNERLIENVNMIPNWCLACRNKIGEEIIAAMTTWLDKSDLCCDKISHIRQLLSAYNGWGENEN